MKQWKSFVIGVSCFRVCVLCLLVSVKVCLLNLFILTTEKLSDWWFKIFVMRWYHLQFTGQNDSAKFELVINFKYKAHLMATVRVAADMHLIGAEVAMPRIDWVGVQRGDQKKSTNRQSSQRRRKDQSNYWSEWLRPDRHRSAQIYAQREWILLCRDSRYATDVFVNIWSSAKN